MAISMKKNAIIVVDMCERRFRADKKVYHCDQSKGHEGPHMTLYRMEYIAPGGELITLKVVR